MTMSYDPRLGQWRYFTKSGFYTNEAVCEIDGRIVSSTAEVLSDRLASRMDMDRRVMAIQNGQIEILTTRNGRKVSEHSVSLDKPIFDIDSMPLLLSEFLKNSPESFNADIVLKSRGWRISVNFQYFGPGSKEISAETGSLPAEYTKLLNGYEAGYYSFRMQAAGILGVFDSTKYFFLFANDNARHFIGYWGGKGDTAEGLILDRKDSTEFTP